MNFSEEHAFLESYKAALATRTVLPDITQVQRFIVSILQNKERAAQSSVALSRFIFDALEENKVPMTRLMGDLLEESLDDLSHEAREEGIRIFIDRVMAEKRFTFNYSGKHILPDELKESITRFEIHRACYGLSDDAMQNPSIHFVIECEDVDKSGEEAIQSSVRIN